MRTKSIYFKNFFFLCGMIIFSFLIFSIAFVTIMRSYIIDERKDSMDTTANEIVKFIPRLNIENNDFSISLTNLKNISGYNIMTANTYGYVTNSSDGFTEHIGMKIDDTVLDSIEEQGNYTEEGTFFGFYSTKHYVVAYKMFYEYSAMDGNAYRVPLGYLILSSDTSSLTDVWSSFTAMFAFVGTIVIVISFFIAVFMARWQTAPMHQMSRAANKFASGDFTARVANGNRQDELGELIDAFNAMADSLEKSENQRREFIANVSHELKTPMTSINGFAEGILDGTIPEDRQNEYLEIIASETKRLSRLVRNMLDTSRVEAMDKEDVLGSQFDIAEVLRRVLLSNESRINAKKLEVEAEIPEEAIYVKGQEDSIMQVVNNLLDNGIKFCDEGGTIGLKAVKNAGKIYVTIKNTGENISKEELPLIFDRFHKTDKSRSLDKEGVGLGLHIVKMLINNHGEKIYVKSENGITEFVFTLTPADKVKE